jgi:membrane protease YdiL (CAAX protease family)
MADARELPNRAAIWPTLAAFLVVIALVFLATTAVVFGVALARSRAHGAPLSDEATRFAFSAPGIMAAALVSSVVFVAVALGTARLQTPDVRGRLRLGPSRATATGFVATVLGMAGLSAASGAAADLCGGRGHGTMDVIARALEHQTVGRLFAAVLTVAVAPGIAEEIFFRGLIQTQLKARWGRLPSVLASATCFGLIHFDVVQGSVAFVSGLFLGWVVERFESVRPSIAAHACNNAAFVFLASTGAGGAISRAVAFEAGGVGLAVCAAATAMVRSRLAIRSVESSSLAQ